MMKNELRVVQICDHKKGRAVAVVQEPWLILVNKFTSVYAAALEAVTSNTKLANLLTENLSETKLDYNTVYEGSSSWKLLPAFDCPHNPFACLVAGTGLTHKNSALNRQMMHASTGDAKPTDSIVMYDWGVKQGFPDPGKIGVQPEWFYKGNGSVLKAHGAYLEVPEYANDGGEEPEIAGIYIVDETGKPHRIGFATGNEFSDHVMEKKNYLYLAPSKLRQCSIGPELVIGGDFTDIQGRVSVTNDEATRWSSDIKTGEKNMAHSLENLEYHHFKYAGHRLPLQAHVHFLGADAFSFGNNVTLQHNDLMAVHWDGMGRALQNRISIATETETLLPVCQL
ncbi:AraD1 family protein [Dyadobacter sp. 3J3]|uniref:AraD1 family protein n=1 Tax=Dyadobacter sp. 3J3 TaxID=2606600 RepID=UPI001E4F70C3|nr:AraD1 family protein [Dyadobacter sp. 3J3]